MYQLKSAAKSLTVELSEYFNELYTPVIEYTKQAYSKARMNIKHEGYIELNDVFQKEYYQTPHKTYKGYRLLGIDGSQIELPHGKQIEEHFGKVNKSDKTVNTSWSTLVYDLLNKQVIDARLNPYGTSERYSAVEQLKEIKKKNKQRQDIIIADRGYPALELFVELREMNYDFLIRYNGEQFLKETSELVSTQKDDITVDISLSKGNKRSQNEAIKEQIRRGVKDTIKLRAVKIELENGVTEYLITSLLDKEEFTKEDFREIYSQRWNHETYYDFQKNVMQIEDFTGKTIESVRQDYYSRILVGNLHSMIVSEAEEQMEDEIKENPVLKHKEYRTNRSVTYGLMRQRIFKMLDLGNEGWEEEYDKLVELAKKYKIPVIKKRNYPIKKSGIQKYPMNKKRVL